MMYYFKKVIDGVITSVEAKSVNVASPNFIEATKEEYDSFIASLPPYVPPEPLYFEASPPGLALGARLNHVEDFLEAIYGKP